MIYYVEFKTWAEGKIETPWPFVWFEETADYRSRKNPAVPINENIVKNIFMNYNEEACGRFLSEHVCAVILGATIEAVSPDAVLLEITKLFGYSEILGVCEITDDNSPRIAEVMKGASISASADHIT